MRFKSLPVTSLEDATVNFEQLSALDVLNLTGESVLQLAVTGTKRVASFGLGSASFTASNISSQPTITHGLGRTPLVVLITNVNNSQATPIDVRSENLTSTTFQVVCVAGASITATQVFCWLAIG